MVPEPLQGSGFGRALRFAVPPAIALAIVLLSSTSPIPATGRLEIQILGPFERGLSVEVAESLRSTFDLEVGVLGEVPLPEEAFYKPRGRYRAEKLLEYLRRLEASKSGRVVGLTAKDISTTKDPVPDWGIFGLAYLHTGPCVVSTYRLRRNASRSLLSARLAKVVRHEVGHTFGLEHCPAPGCVMEDAKGSIKGVDSSDGSFCATCKVALGPFLRNR